MAVRTGTRILAARYPLPWWQMTVLTVVQLLLSAMFVLSGATSAPWVFSDGNDKVFIALLYLTAQTFFFSALVILFVCMYRLLGRRSRVAEFIGVLIFLCGICAGFAHHAFFGGFPGWRTITEAVRSSDVVIPYLFHALTPSIALSASLVFMAACLAAWSIAQSISTIRFSSERLLLMSAIGFIPVLTGLVGPAFPALAEGYHPVFNSSFPQFRLLASISDSLLGRDLSVVRDYVPPPVRRYASESWQSDRRPRHVVLVIADSLRADHFRAAAAPKRIEWKRLFNLESYWLSRFYTQAPYTGAAFATIFSSRYLAGSTERREATQLSKRFWDNLKNAGVRTSFLSATDLEWDSIKTVTSASQADVFIGRRQLDHTDWDNDWAVLPIFRSFLHQPVENRTVSVFFLVGTHFPYTTKYRTVPGSMADEDRYKSAVAELADWIQELANIMKETNVLDRAVIAITGDHGESFGAHGVYGHGYSLLEEQIRVPMLLMVGSEVDVPAPCSECLHSHVDIVPTIQDLLGIPPMLESQGISVFSGKNKAYEVVPYESLTRSVAILREWEKFIYDVDEGRVKHFDLARDPTERRNLWDRKTPELRGFLEQVVPSTSSQAASGQ